MNYITKNTHKQTRLQSASRGTTVAALQSCSGRVYWNANEV